MFSTIGLIGHKDDPAVLASVERLYDCFSSHKSVSQIFMQESFFPSVVLKDVKRASLEEMILQCDLMVVVGGDGSLLHATHSLAAHDVPLLGINRGNLGFLADILPEDIETTLPAILAGRYLKEQRFLLSAQLNNGDKENIFIPALNDVVLDSASSARMIKYALFIDEQFVFSQNADGLIVATPTGSTAYALSAGGPIIHPEMDALVLIPMLSHTLGSRPLVIKGNHKLTVHYSQHNRTDAHINCDGQTKIKLRPGDEVVITKYPHKIILIHPENYRYYEICRSKLGWERNSKNYYKATV